MLKLVDRNYYFYKYGGSSIPESSFEKYSKDASIKVHHYTFNRIQKEEDITNDIRDATCSIMNLLYEQEKLYNKLNIEEEKASETVGPHSVTYINKSNLQSQRVLNSSELDKECYRICIEYLVNTGLMYPGV